jgi:hypothetical protein
VRGRARMAAICALACSMTTARAFALGIASISLSSGTLPVTWSNAGTTDTFLTADAGNGITVTGTMQTTALTGSGSITITAPATITGSQGAPLSPSNIAVTCSGSAISGQTFVASKTPLAAGGSITCARYNAGFTSTNVSVTLRFYLNDQNIPADTYITSAAAFGIVATAS